MGRRFDVVVVGSGPNGLSAAVELARHGLSVCVLEAQEEIGGGTRTAELTLPGFLHDICSAIHPLGIVSPFFRSLPIEKYGVEWIVPEASVAHPLEDGGAAILYKQIGKTLETLDRDADSYKDFMLPFVGQSHLLLPYILGPLRWPDNPGLVARFGWTAIRSCLSIVNQHFQKPPARALFAGCAGHSFLRMDQPGSAGFGLVLSMIGHGYGWPVVGGGSQKIASALAYCLKEYEGVIETNRPVRSFADLPSARIYVFDTTPAQLLQIVGDRLSAIYRKRISGFRYGPGIFKIDWALSDPIPWKAADCSRAATVHVGGTLEEIATAEVEIFRGKHPDKPFVVVAQQSLFDPARAPNGKHTAWGYCHVPNGSVLDMTEAIEYQIERFAPGFRQQILKRHIFTTEQMEKHNENLRGGDISGGANTLKQMLARPLLSLDPYATSNKQIFLCSSSTPPGGGVHGMCGYHAAQSVLRKIRS